MLAKYGLCLSWLVKGYREQYLQRIVNSAAMQFKHVQVQRE